MLKWSRLAVNNLCEMYAVPRKNHTKRYAKFAANSRPSFAHNKINLLSNEQQRIKVK